MKKAQRFLAVIIFVTGFTAACNLTLVTPLPAPPAPTQPSPVDTVTPTQPALNTVTPEPQNFAPACPPCPAPDLKDTAPNETYCVKKIPYQNFSVEPGAKFESLDPASGLMCFDSGGTREVNGRKLKIWACTSKPLWTSALKVTTPACGLRMILKLDPSRCPVGLMYSAAQNCCISLVGNNALSVTIKVNMGACK